MAINFKQKGFERISLAYLTPAISILLCYGYAVKGSYIS